MTRKTNARIAGIAFLFYIAAGILSMILSRRASGGGVGIAAKLAGMAEHATDVRLAYILGLLTIFAALALGVSLWSITRDEDPDLAMLGLACRVAEGVVGASVPTTLALLWLATTTGAGAPDTASAHALGMLLGKIGQLRVLTSATLFAVGSTIFCWLLLRGRMIPLPLAWLGVASSVLLVVVLPFQLVGFFGGGAYQLVWLPMAVFELTLGPWLIIKGVRMPEPRSSTGS